MTFNVYDFVFVVLCVLFRYLIIVLGLFYLIFVSIYFAFCIYFKGVINLGFSQRYYDESRLSLLIYILFLKLPLAGAKYVVYSFLKLLFSSSKGGVRFSFCQFFLNLLFVNLFGSPKWLLSLALSLSSSYMNAISVDLSSKNRRKILNIRIRLVIDAINTCLNNECVYFLEKCKKSRIYVENNKLFFNMRKLTMENNMTFARNNFGILRTLTMSENGKIKEHPLYHPDYKKGSSDGSMLTHSPLRDQKCIASKGDLKDDTNCVVVNNIQSSEMISEGSNRGVVQSGNSMKTLGYLGELLRVHRGFKIFFQDKNGFGLLNDSFRNISDEGARGLGLGEDRIERLKEVRNMLCFDSESGADLFNNSLNGVLKHDLNNNKFNSYEYRIDSRIIPNNNWFDNLNEVDRIIELNRRSLIWNEITLDDEEILEILNRPMIGDSFSNSDSMN